MQELERAGRMDAVLRERKAEMDVSDYHESAQSPGREGLKRSNMSAIVAERKSRRGKTGSESELIEIGITEKQNGNTRKRFSLRKEKKSFRHMEATPSETNGAVTGSSSSNEDA